MLERTFRRRRNLTFHSLSIVVFLSTFHEAATGQQPYQTLTKDLEANYPGYAVRTGRNWVTTYQLQNGTDEQLQERALNYAKTFFLDTSADRVVIRFDDARNRNKYTTITILRSMLEQIARNKDIPILIPPILRIDNTPPRAKSEAHLQSQKHDLLRALPTGHEIISTSKKLDPSNSSNSLDALYDSINRQSRMTSGNPLAYQTSSTPNKSSLSPLNNSSGNSVPVLTVEQQRAMQATYESRVSKGAMKTYRANLLRQIDALKARGKNVSDCLKAFYDAEHIAQAGSEPGELAKQLSIVQRLVTEAERATSPKAIYKQDHVQTYR